MHQLGCTLVTLFLETLGIKEKKTCTKENEQGHNACPKKIGMDTARYPDGKKSKGRRGRLLIAPGKVLGKNVKRNPQNPVNPRKRSKATGYPWMLAAFTRDGPPEEERERNVKYSKQEKTQKSSVIGIAKKLWVVGFCLKQTVKWTPPELQFKEKRGK